MSIRTLPARFSAPAASSASSDIDPAVALTTTSPNPAASANDPSLAPSPTSATQATRLLVPGAPAIPSSPHARAPRASPRSPDPTIPVPSTPKFIAPHTTSPPAHPPRCLSVRSSLRHSAPGATPVRAHFSAPTIHHVPGDPSESPTSLPALATWSSATHMSAVRDAPGTPSAPSRSPTTAAPRVLPSTAALYRQATDVGTNRRSGQPESPKHRRLVPTTHDVGTNRRCGGALGQLRARAPPRERSVTRYKRARSDARRRAAAEGRRGGFGSRAES